MARFAHLEWPFFDQAHRRLAREAVPSGYGAEWRGSGRELELKGGAQ